MLMGIVKGMVVSTQKEESMVGSKLLVVQQIDANGKAVGSDEVAVDVLGAGVGEKVLLCSGSSARTMLANPQMPVDLIVVGIIDTIQC